VVDAPAAVTSIHEEEIAQVAATGQVPKILEFTPGAEITQRGLYDFNFNTRGFNSSLNRRVSTYIDGRDVGVVLLGAQEWAAISGGLDDVAKLEFVRGPSAALYGANASSGVVNILTKNPKDSLGGLVRTTFGELNSRGVDFRQAFQFGDGWYAKVLAGFKDSGDFTVSRNPDVVRYPEYSEFCLLVGQTDCLPGERTLLREQDNEIRFGAVRVDRYVSDEVLLTAEIGLSTIKGPVFQTGIGRVQNLESERPFYRFNFSSPHWNVLAHYTSREGDQVNLLKALVVNYDLITDDERYGVEFQGNWNLGDNVRFVIGGAHTEENVDSINPATGKQTVLWEPVSSNRQALFSQADWSPNRHMKFVFAGRVDKSTLHETQFSPKAAAVWNINSENSMRLTYNRAFQVANYSEYFLHTPISYFPIGGFVRTICGAPILPEPVDCGIDEEFVPILAVGNDDLKLEHTEAWELGYSGLLANKVLVTIDYYRAKNTDFITDLVQQVGTILGNTEGCVDHRLNPSTDPKVCTINNDYKPWISTEEAETTYLVPAIGLTVAQALRNAINASVGGRELGFRLAQDLDGSTVIVGRTYANLGRVDTQGVDLGVQWFITPWLNLQFSYSLFDYEIVEPGGDIEEVEEILLPNSPPHKVSAVLSLNRERWDASVGARWVHGFRWSAGIYQGDVPEYSSVDLSAGYKINDHVRVGVNVANARDTAHYESFGGDLLYRRALANVTFGW
ncbi:MAG TPA: TonB-dependent receptor, partial [Candidatus Polarisedimenticolaceae bacterium]